MGPLWQVRRELMLVGAGKRAGQGDFLYTGAMKIRRGGQPDHGPVAPGVMICMVPGGSTEIQSLRLAGVWLGV